MKKDFMVFACMTLLVLTGCDTFRKMTGRPTSKEIAAARLAETQRQQSEAAKADSMALAALTNENELVEADAFGGISQDNLPYKYYIIVGAFKQEGNAGRMKKRVEGDGYSATIIKFNNGFDAVGLMPANELPEVFRSLRDVKKESFCPEDVWILVNR